MKKGGSRLIITLVTIALPFIFSIFLLLTSLLYYFNYIIISLAITITARIPRNRVYGRLD
jgi:hypothetical protein